jgi:hypothetical protein
VGYENPLVSFGLPIDSSEFTIKHLETICYLHTRELKAMKTAMAQSCYSLFREQGGQNVELGPAVFRPGGRDGVKHHNAHQEHSQPAEVGHFLRLTTKSYCGVLLCLCTN